MPRPAIVLTALLAAGCIAIRRTPDPFHVHLVNQSQEHIRAYAHPPLGRAYYLIGSVLPGQSRAIPARCEDFLGRSTSIRLRAGLDDTFLSGWGVIQCSDSLVVFIPTDGVALASVEVWP